MNRLADREDLVFFFQFPLPPVGSDGALLIGAAETTLHLERIFCHRSDKEREGEKKVIIRTAGSLTVLNTSALKP